MRHFVYARLYEPFQAYHMGIWIRLNPLNMINTTPEAIDGHVLWPQKTYHFVSFSKSAVDGVFDHLRWSKTTQKMQSLGSMAGSKHMRRLSDRKRDAKDRWFDCLWIQKGSRNQYFEHRSAFFGARKLSRRDSEIYIIYETSRTNVSNNEMLLDEKNFTKCS